MHAAIDTQIGSGEMDVLNEQRRFEVAHESRQRLHVHRVEALANAEEGTAIDLEDQGTGDSHKLDRATGGGFRLRRNVHRYAEDIGEELAERGSARSSAGKSHDSGRQL